MTARQPPPATTGSRFRAPRIPWMGTLWAALREQRPILLPLVILTLVAFTASVAMWPALARALASQGDAVTRGARFSLWLAAVLAPGVGLAKAGVLAGCGWALATLAMREVRITPLFSLLLVGQIVIAARDLFVVAILYLRGLDRIGGAPDLLIPTGIDLVAPPTSPAGLALAQTTGLFDIIWAGFVFVGLQLVCGVARRDAVIGTLALWTVRVAFAMLRAGFLG